MNWTVIERQLEGIPCRFCEPMKKHTTFRIGGPAAIWLEPVSEEQIIRAFLFFKQENIPFFILGRGSNLLVGDGMLERAVIYLGENFSAIRRNDERHLYAQAGASLTRLCRTAAGFSLSGLEFAYGIPGSVGGGIYMNAGAYGGELKDVVESVDYLDEDGNRHTLTVQELAFGYRRSMFSYRKCCILGASFALVPGDHQAIAARMEDVMQRRREKQPLEYPSAGSTFKRPEGAYAAELIDRCGLKGVSVGDAQVSEKHAGFLINRGNATCADMLGLIEIVRRTVLEQTGFLLEREVELLETEG